MDGFIASLCLAAIAFGVGVSVVPTYTPVEIEWAQSVCEKNGGLAELYGWTTKATCNNGAEFKKEPTK